MSGGDLSSTILRIYQTLAVEFQTARAEQIYITNRRYATTIHHFLHLVFFILFLLLFIIIILLLLHFLLLPRD
jgi:hypothetical protein